MPRFAVSTTIDASPERVWALLGDWEGSEAWMVDATTVRVLSVEREGPGTRVEAITKIAGIPLKDVMTVRVWDAPHLMVVDHHHWPIRGVAWFELTPVAGARTRLDWVEEIDPPLGPIGELGGLLLKEPIEGVLAKSAAKLKKIVEAPRSTRV